MRNITSQNIVDIIGNLNQELYEQLEGWVDITYITYSTDGYIDIIKFFDYTIWNSDDDCRDYINEETGEKENLEIYLRREINRFIDNLKEIKL